MEPLIYLQNHPEDMAEVEASYAMLLHNAYSMQRTYESIQKGGLQQSFIQILFRKFVQKQLIQKGAVLERFDSPRLDSERYELQGGGSYVTDELPEAWTS